MSEDNIREAVTVFRNSISSQTATGIATIKGLLSMLASSSATTMVELVENLRVAASEFKKEQCSNIAIKSASDLFNLFITQVGGLGLVRLGVLVFILFTLERTF